MGDGPRPLEGLAVTPAFWAGRRVFITGHTGFKGGWLALWLQRAGAQTTGYALRPETDPNLFTLARVAARMCAIEGDVRDVDHLARAIADSSPEIVFHLSAQPLVLRSYANPLETFATNVMGTVHVLESVRHAPSVRAVVIVTSDKCYANREQPRGYREDDAMGGHDPYSSSKACAELVTSAYRASYFSAREAAPIASVRAGNVIGGGDWGAERLVPDLVRARAQGGSVTLRSPSAVRPWQHVLDPLDGYLRLAERLFNEGGKYAEAWNFGPADADARTVDWVVNRFRGHWPDVQVEVGPPRAGAHEAHLLTVDSAKARLRLGWRTKLDAGAAIAWTADWYDGVHRDPDSALSLATAQIERYEALQ